MAWDGLLLAILIYQMIRCAQRGGSAVGLELASFLITYAVTFTIAPLLTAVVRDSFSIPLPFLPLISILGIYLATRASLRRVLRRFKKSAEIEASLRNFQPLLSRTSGACLGLVRGGIVVVAIAMLGSCLPNLQRAGLLKMLPATEHSIAINHARGWIEVATDRLTRDAGPTVQLLLSYATDPSGEKKQELFESPFAKRLRDSEPVAEFVNNVEVQTLVREHQRAQLLMHPAFIRVVKFAVNELIREKNDSALSLSYAKAS